MHSVMGLTGSEHTSGHGTERIRRYLSPVPAGSTLRGRVNIAEQDQLASSLQY